MVINHAIRFRASPSQIERIKLVASNRGFPNASAYLRELALNSDMYVETKLVEISKDVKRILELLE
jgi:hypothetical protein